MNVFEFKQIIAAALLVKGLVTIGDLQFDLTLERLEASK